MLEAIDCWQLDEDNWVICGFPLVTICTMAEMMGRRHITEAWQKRHLMWAWCNHAKTWYCNVMTEWLSSESHHKGMVAQLHGCKNEAQMHTTMSYPKRHVTTLHHNDMVQWPG